MTKISINITPSHQSVFDFQEYALSRSYYEADGTINYRVKFWHDLQKHEPEMRKRMDECLMKILENNK